MMGKSGSEQDFDKYKYYLDSVQSPEEDAEFIAKTYQELNDGARPEIFREDFCAAFALCCEWVKGGDERRAIGIDLDEEPLNYGTRHYLSQLNSVQQKRVRIMRNNVLEPELPTADIIAAMNFSYMGFKQRTVLLDYMKNCHRTLNANGLLVLDCFGGSGAMEPNEHETIHDDYSYYWDQDTYNPVTHEAMFYIHFKRKGEKKRREVFTYDWRLWSLAELRELMQEAGFRSSYVYWEGTDEDGDGNGEFTRTEEGDDAESWVAYVVGHK